MSIQISVVICTLNRAAYLKKAIKSLLNQTISKKEYEIIIIDSDSIDDTKAVVESFCKYGNIHYISEPKMGLSAARNVGIENASGDIVAFMDDDAMADESWLKEIINTFTKVKPTPAACGGKVELHWEFPRPNWLSESLLHFLGEFDYGDEAFFVKTPDKFLGGLNMAFHKDTFKRIGLFNVELGRIGGKLLSYDEIEFFHRMLNKNLKMYYNPKIIVTHHVTKERLEKKWHYQRFYYEGVSVALMDFYMGNQRKEYDTKEFFKTIYLLARALGIELLYNFQSFKDEEKAVTRKCMLKLSIGYNYQHLINFLRKLL